MTKEKEKPTKRCKKCGGLSPNPYGECMCSYDLSYFQYDTKKTMTKEKKELQELKEKRGWVAYYQPILSDGRANPSKIFKTKKQAEEHIKERCCKDCQKEGLDSSCACEWLIIPIDKFQKAKNHGELLEAAGYKNIQKKL